MPSYTYDVSEAVTVNCAGVTLYVPSTVSTSILLSEEAVTLTFAGYTPTGSLSSSNVSSCGTTDTLIPSAALSSSVTLPLMTVTSAVSPDGVVPYTPLLSLADTIALALPIVNGTSSVNTL